MKLLHIKKSHVIWLVGLRPKTKPAPRAYLIDLIAKRYSFVGFPTNIQELGDEVVFQDGQYDGLAIDKLSLFPDGLVAESTGNTKDVDAFLDDAVAWATAELGYEVISTPGVRQTITKTYSTTLEAHLELDLERWLSQLSPVTELLNSLMKGSAPAPYRPAGIYFNYDDTLNKPVSTGTFKLERKIAKRFDPNVYLSIAPLTTDDHVKFLESLEQTSRRK
jgi:hypothetical protein